MNRLFGKAKEKPTGPTINDVTQSVDQRAEVYEKKIQMLDAELLKCREQMKKMREGPAKKTIQQKALRLLKQKKQYDSQRDNLMQLSFNLEQTNFASQQLKETAITVEAMKSGVKQMKQEFKKINLNEIEDIQDDMEDMLYDANEVQELFGRSYGVPDVDESELEAELEAIGEEMQANADTSFLDEVKEPTTVLPNAPDATELDLESSKIPSFEPKQAVAESKQTTKKTTDPIKEPW